MAYNSDYFGCINPGGSKESIRIFTLVSEDAEASIDDTNYISDGVAKGARLGDAVLVWATDDVDAPTSFELEWWQVTAVGTTGVTIAQGAAIT